MSKGNIETESEKKVNKLNEVVGIFCAYEGRLHYMVGKNKGLGLKQIWVQMPILLLPTSCVTLSKLLNSSKPK